MRKAIKDCVGCAQTCWVSVCKKVHGVPRVKHSVTQQHMPSYELVLGLTFPSLRRVPKIIGSWSLSTKVNKNDDKAGDKVSKLGKSTGVMPSAQQGHSIEIQHIEMQIASFNSQPTVQTS